MVCPGHWKETTWSLTKLDSLPTETKSKVPEWLFLVKSLRQEPTSKWVWRSLSYDSRIHGLGMNSVRAWSSISFSKIMDIRSHPLNTLGNFSNCFTNILKPPTVEGVFHLAAIKELLIVVQRISLPDRKTWSIITWKAWKNITTSSSQRDKPHQPAAMSWGPNPLSQSMQVPVGINPLWNLT